ncbi:hypothetical protein [Reyranella sp.]
MRPFKAHNVAEFTFDPRGPNTTVTWAMLGEDFEVGLQNLKAIAER